jgi:DNA polymerase-1
VEDKLLPPVQDILGGVLGDFPVEDVELWNQYTTDPTLPVLVLGNMPPITPINYVKTLSQKQLLSSGSGLTELHAAITRLLTPPTYAPMEYMVIDGDVRFSAAYLTRNLDNIVVVDIETGGNIKTMLPEELWLLSVALTSGGKVIVLGEEALAREDNRKELTRFLTSGVKLIAQNMKFDFRTLSAQLGVQIRGHLDTMLFSHAVNPGARSEDHGLKKIAKKYLGAEDWETETSNYVKGKVGYEAIPRHILYEYNAYDAYWTWHLYEYFARAAQGDERIAKIAKFEFRMSNLFQDIERNGVAVDLDYLDVLHADLSAQEEENLVVIREMAGEKFNPNSPQQVKEFYESIGVSLKSTAVGKLEELDFEEGSLGQRFTDSLLAARKITKLKGTYVEGIQKRTHAGIVYPDFLVHGTSTGRLSSRDPNIQNIPRDEEGKISLRRIFIPRDVATRSLVSVDYSQAELRVMACLAEDEYLISLFQPGMPDFFDSLMPVAFPRVDLSTLDKNTKKNMRAKLKGVIYGLSYGRGANAIAKALGMPPREAQQIITNYFRAAPNFYAWRQWVEQTALSPEHTLVSPFGRYYQAEVVTGKNRQNVINSGLAFLPQSTASDLCVVAAMEVQKWLPQYDAVIVATIHDAILVDCPDEHIEVVAEKVQEAMRASGRQVFTQVPFDTDATWGKSWQGI